MVYDGATLRLYKDAVEIGSVPVTGKLAQDSSIAASIGNNPSGEKAFDGTIDEVRVYRRALTAAELLALTNETEPNPEPEPDPGNESLNEGLIGHWPFIEQEGTTVKDTVNNNDAGFIDSPSYTNGQLNDALSFDGYNDGAYATTTQGLGTENLSLATWVYFPDEIQSDWRAILEYGRFTDNWYGLFKSKNGNQFHFRWSRGGKMDSNTLISANTWYHIVGTYDKDTQTAKLYINGELDKTLTAAESATILNSSILAIGQNVKTDIPGAGESKRLVKVRAYNKSDTLNLGGNGGTSGATSMYTVVIKKQ